MSSRSAILDQIQAAGPGQVWVPADWLEEHRALFIGWLRQQAGVALDWARACGSGEPRWSLESVDAPEAGWDRLLPCLNELHADHRPRLLMVLAAHSLVDEACVTGLQARGELFTTLHQSGRVPGEGAAGLLLANAPMLACCADGAEHPWLGAPRTARRQRSADRAGRPGADEFTAVHRLVIKPLAAAGACVVGIDHLSKGLDSRKFGPTGTVAKRRVISGSCIRVTVDAAFTPDKGGSAFLAINKDRHGGLRRASPSGDKEPSAGKFVILGGQHFITAPMSDEKNPGEHAPPADVAAITALDPPPASAKEARERLKWRDERARQAFKDWKKGTTR